MPNTERAQKGQVRRLLGKFWTVANLLSLSRLVLVVPITYLILTDGSMALLFGLLALAVLTDWFDGRVARWSKTVSEWGKVLDPLADKVAAAMITLALVVRGSLPLWLLMLIVARDVFIVLGGMILARRTTQVVMSIWMGKVAVTALSITVLAALLRADEPVLTFCVWVTAGLLVYSFLLYVLRFIRLLRYGRLPERDEEHPEEALRHIPEGGSEESHLVEEPTGDRPFGTARPEKTAYRPTTDD